MVNQQKVLVSNIQRMCMNDGPGIRTTVFFKGCNLRCPWCANPENISSLPQTYVQRDGYVGVYGKEYSSEELYSQLIKDKQYWSNSGGVTFSGGEPFLQLKLIGDLLEKMRQEKVHLAVETALQIPIEDVAPVLDYINLFIVDVKILDVFLAEKVIGGNVANYIENLKYLSKCNKDVLFRFPCCTEYTVTKGNIDMVLDLLKNYSEWPVEIFGVHSLGREKYESLGMSFHEFEQMSLGELEFLWNKLSQYGNRITIKQI